jgi:hypothetical protein
MLLSHGPHGLTPTGMTFSKPFIWPTRNFVRHTPNWLPNFARPTRNWLRNFTKHSELATKLRTGSRSKIRYGLGHSEIPSSSIVASQLLEEHNEENNAEIQKMKDEIKDEILAELKALNKAEIQKMKDEILADLKADGAGKSSFFGFGF